MRENLIQYKVVYGRKKSATFTYNKKTRQVKLLEFLIEGEDLLKAFPPSLKNDAVTKNEGVLFNFLKGVRPEIGEGRIKHISYDLEDVYEVYLVSHLGSFVA